MDDKLSAELMEQLLTPLSEESPAGEYLKENKPAYRSLRNTYAIAHNSLQKLLLNPVDDEQESLELTNKKNWQTLETELLEVLSNNARDLECLAWLVMTQLFTDDPYTQFTKALSLMIRSLATFGNAIQPFLPDDKLQGRSLEEAALERARAQCRPCVFLFGESSDSCPIVPLLKMLPLIGEFTYIDYCHYHLNKKSEDDDDYGNNDNDQGQSFLKQVIHYASKHQEEVFARIETLNTLLSVLDELNVALKNHFQPFGIEDAHTGFVKEVVTDSLRAIQDLVKDALIFPEDKPENSEGESEGSESTDSHGATRQAGGLKQVSSRDEAFQQLKQLSAFFRETEPQSPVSYLLEKALRWGYTPLPKLLSECIGNDETTLEQLSTLFGINTDEQKNQEER